MIWPFGNKAAWPQPDRPLDPRGHRLIALTAESGAPILAPKGHSLLLSANGGGKTTCGAMNWLLSFAASEPEKAILVLDSKNGELAFQTADMLAKLGRKVVIVCDMGVMPASCAHRVSLMRYAAMFIWLILPIGAFGAYAIYGLPHMIWSYRFENNGDPFNPFAKRYYVDCTFWGPYGRFTVHADAGRCGWVKFFRSNADRNQWTDFTD